jgi:hypothetical protein
MDVSLSKRPATSSTVILRCAPLRASKDGRKHGAEHHPSRRAEDGAHLRMTAFARHRSSRGSVLFPAVTIRLKSSSKENA